MGVNFIQKILNFDYFKKWEKIQNKIVKLYCELPVAPFRAKKYGTGWVDGWMNGWMVKPG